MDKKIDDLKKNIDQWFEGQSKMIKIIVHHVCALLIENIKAIIKAEIKDEIDGRVNSEEHTLQQEILSMKQVNLQI